MASGSIIYKSWGRADEVYVARRGAGSENGPLRHAEGIVQYLAAKACMGGESAALGVTSMKSIKLPLWLRFVLLVGVVVFAAGAGLVVYRYYNHPVTLTVAVGSIDGEAAKAMSALASELVSTNAPVRLKVIDSGTSLEAAKVFRTTRC